jgi:hypothetical protein
MLSNPETTLKRKRQAAGPLANWGRTFRGPGARHQGPDESERARGVLIMAAPAVIAVVIAARQFGRAIA